MKDYETIYGVTSIIIPCYNSSDKIEVCFKSLLSQTEKNIEILFVDDGSTDNTYKILCEFQVNFKNLFYDIKVIRHEGNQEVASAINTGIINARGEYLIWLDSDDSFEEDYVELLTAKLRDNEDIDVVTCVADCVRDGKIYGYYGKYRKCSNLFEQTLLQQSGLYGVGITACRTKVLRDCLPNGIIGEPHHVTEQNFYILNMLALKSKFESIDKILYHYIYWGNSTSHKKASKVNWKLHCDQVDRIKNQVIYDSKISEAYRTRCFGLWHEKSFLNRMRKLTLDVYDNDRKYCDLVVNEFLNNGCVKDNIKNRNVWIWGGTEEILSMGEILKKYLSVAGFIESQPHKGNNNNIVCANVIDKNSMYIIVPVGRHIEIENLLRNAEFISGLDYYYPNSRLYED